MNSENAMTILEDLSARCGQADNALPFGVQGFNRREQEGDRVPGGKLAGGNCKAGA